MLVSGIRDIDYRKLFDLNKASAAKVVLHAAA